MAEGLDWPGLMRAGLHELRLDPERFWALSPVELAVMRGVAGGPAPLGRARLEELMRAWPDRGREGTGDDGE